MPIDTPSANGTADPDDALYKTIEWRLLPILLMSYVISYLDRVNVGFAKLQMKELLGFSDAVFGVGAGLLFLGYFLFEIPGSILLTRIGAKKTLLRIMVLWGFAAVAITWARTPTQFYIARFLLGVCEAGFVPGVILYLTYWFPRRRRGRVFSKFLFGSVLGSAISGPLCGATMKFLDGAFGLAGWQWIYLTQGTAAIGMGILAYFLLVDSPKDAPWLNDEQRAVVRRNLDDDEDSKPDADRRGLWAVLLRDPRVFLLALAHFLMLGATYAMVFLLPTLIRNLGVVDIFVVGLLSTLPSCFGVIGMYVFSRHSDMRRERHWHFLLAIGLAGIGLGGTAVFHGQFVLSIAAMCLAGFGMISCQPLFFAATTEYFPARLAVVGIPLITSFGMLGAAASSMAIGFITSMSGDVAYSVYFVVVVCFSSGLVMVVSRVRNTTGNAA